MTPDLSILIVTWNTKERIQECLQSIFTCAPKIQFEIVVVDNASQDGTVDLILAKFPSVSMIQNTENIGYGPAQNKAFHVSRGRYVLILNSDVVVTDGALEGLVRYMDSHPDIGLVGGRLQNPDGTFQSSANRRFPSPLDVFLEELFFSSSLKFLFLRTRFGATCSKLFWNLKEPQSVAWVGGACMLIRRSVMEHVGLFDGHFFFYYEDCDLCLRIRRAGWKVAYDPRQHFIHQWGSSSQKNVRKVSIEARRSLLYYFLKHNGTFGFLAVKYALLVGLALRYLLLSLKAVLAGKERERSLLFREMLLLFHRMKDPSIGLPIE